MSKEQKDAVSTAAKEAESKGIKQGPKSGANKKPTDKNKSKPAKSKEGKSKTKPKASAKPAKPKDQNKDTGTSAEAEPSLTDSAQEKSTGAAGDSKPKHTARQIANACRSLTTERRAELFVELYGRKPAPTATVRTNCSALGKALEGKQEIPPDVLDKMPNVSKGGHGGARERFGIRSLFRELSARPGGVSMKELREEAAARGVNLGRSKVAKSNGRLKSHVVGPAKRMGWDIQERDGSFYGKAPAKPGGGEASA